MFLKKGSQEKDFPFKILIQLLVNFALSVVVSTRCTIQLHPVVNCEKVTKLTKKLNTYILILLITY